MKQRSISSNGEICERVALSILGIQKECTLTFQEFAAQTINWINRNKSIITTEDTELFLRLRDVFVRCFPETDKNVEALMEFYQKSQISKEPGVKTVHPFAAVTRYLPDREFWLAKSEIRSQERQVLCERLDQMDWMTIMQDYKEHFDDLAVDGLGAFYHEKIAVEQFCTLIFCWSLMRQFSDVEIKVYSLFDAVDSMNPFAVALIRQTLSFSGQLQKEQSGFLNKQEQFFSFMDRMRQQSSSEKCFFLVKVDNDYCKDLSTEEIQKKMQAETLDIVESIHERSGINVFNKVSYEGFVYRMIPSFSMMQQFLIAYAGDANAVKISPVIGLSTREDIYQNAISDTRDIALPFLGVELPKEADLLLVAKDLNFIYHDFFHSIMASVVPRQCRLAFAIYADAVAELKSRFQDPDVIQFLDALYERAIDMEYPVFRQDVSMFNVEAPTLTLQLLSSIELIRFSAISRIIHDENRSGRGDQMQSFLEKYYNICYLQKIYEKLAHILFREKFCLRYGITQEDLQIIAVQPPEFQEKLEHLEKMEREAQEKKEERKDIEFNGEKMTQLQWVIFCLKNIDLVNISAQLLVCMKEDKYSSA